ncbi:hypothetical protein N8Z75_00165 [Crocinitomicaceae bacterium]|nr:hypothetical protein [Crocinitomicaceae bacterium]
MKTTLLFLSVFLTTALFGQLTYVPDWNFEALLEANGMGNDIQGDHYVFTSNISQVEELVIPQTLSIYDLTGIEDFESLKRLEIPNNNLTILNVSQNINLEFLKCGGNELILLDVWGCPNLKNLFCENNSLTYLNVNENIMLDSLRCQMNNLTNLNLAQNTQLSFLLCANNLIDNLDLTNNPNLVFLGCYDNQLTNIDLSQNLLIETVWVYTNQITSLDVSQNSNLSYLVCSNNNLSCLNLKNGSNTLIEELYFIAHSNPNLTCIQVDDANWSSSIWNETNGNIDNQMYFSENCNYPSDCFTASLTELTTSKNLIQILDLMGRETSFKPNTPLIYVYDDGSIEKVFTIE